MITHLLRLYSWLNDDVVHLVKLFVHLIFPQESFFQVTGSNYKHQPYLTKTPDFSPGSYIYRD